MNAFRDLINTLPMISWVSTILLSIYFGQIKLQRLRQSTGPYTNYLIDDLVG